MPPSARADPLHSLQAVWPIGGRSSDPRQAAQDFFLAYLAAPILLGIWVVVYIWKRTLPKALKDIDLDVSFALNLARPAQSS